MEETDVRLLVFAQPAAGERSADTVASARQLFNFLAVSGSEVESTTIIRDKATGAVAVNVDTSLPVRPTDRFLGPARPVERLWLRTLQVA